MDGGGDDHRIRRARIHVVVEPRTLTGRDGRMFTTRRATLRASLLAVVAIGCTADTHGVVPQGVLRTPTDGWIDATAVLDPATTPIYEGDAPMRFDFLKDMRKGDPLTLSAYSMGAHSGTHIDAPMHFVA